MFARDFQPSRWSRRRVLQLGGAACVVGLSHFGAWARQDGGFPLCLEIEPWYAGELARKNLLRYANPEARALTQAQALQRSLRHIAPPSRRPGASRGPVPAAMRGLPPDRRTEAARALETIAEASPSADIPLVLKALVARLKKWPARSRVNYAFVTRDRAPLASFVKAALEEWAGCCCLDFQDVTARGGAADIRISFVANAGHYSNVGTDSRDRAFSLNSSGQFESLNLDPSGLFNLEYMRGTARHEVGHAIGLNHEHQISDHGIVWNKPAVFAEYRASQGWSDDQINQNIFQKLNDPAQYAFTPRDADSVMHYWFKRSLILDDGGVRVPETPNLTLSETDKRFVRVQYGCEEPSGGGDPEHPDPAPTRVVGDRRKLKSADAAVLEPDTIQPGKFPSDPPMHLYRLQVAGDAGREYVLETIDGARHGQATLGAMPVVIELFEKGDDFAAANAIQVSEFGASRSGPEPGSLGVQDAYLRRKLEPGKSYYALVRPLQRSTGDDSAASYRLLLRPAAGPRPKNSDTGSWGDLFQEIELLHEKLGQPGRADQSLRRRNRF